VSTATAIIIAAYNAEATLDRAVESALLQPETAEICIVDDASRDGTLARAGVWAARDKRVRVIAQASNAGPAAARNAAIAATTAPWITILDADDYLLPGRLAALHNSAGAAHFVADALIRTPEGAPSPLAPNALFAPHPMSFVQFVLGNLGAETGPLDLGFLKPMFRRSFIEVHVLRYREEMRLGEDYEFYARALALGAHFVVGGAAGYVSVEREGSLSKAHSEIDLQHLRDCDDALAALPTLSHQERAALGRHRASVDCRLQWRRLITAVKQRDAGAALRAFHSPRTAIYLAARLAEQMWLRSTGRGPVRASRETARAADARRGTTSPGAA
jgi:succinoglycan biosynthesis protein ExoU